MDIHRRNRYQFGKRKGLTSHGIGTGHEVQRDGVGRVGGHAFQAALRDFVEAVGGCGHVFIHPVQKRVHAWFLGLPEFEISPQALAIFPASLHVLRIAGKGGCKHKQNNKKTLFRVLFTLGSHTGSPWPPFPNPCVLISIYWCCESILFWHCVVLLELNVFSTVARKQWWQLFRQKKHFTLAGFSVRQWRANAASTNMDPNCFKLTKSSLMQSVFKMLFSFLL